MRAREREKQSQSCHLAAKEHEDMHNHTKFSFLKWGKISISS